MTDLAGRTLLVPFLFTIDHGGGAEWYGVSAYSLEDAVVLLRKAGFDVDPASPEVSVRDHVRLTDFEDRHIGPNMGPWQFRGVWYPCMNL